MYQAAEERYQKMDYVYCGKSGLKLPEVSLGFWHNFGDTGVYENMKQICFTAFDNGITTDRNRAVPRRILAES